jgi:hypothetical protein
VDTLLIMNLEPIRRVLLQPRMGVIHEDIESGVGAIDTGVQAGTFAGARIQGHT